MSELKRRNARNKEAGARWQRDLRNGLRLAGLDVERLALSGNEDEGDHVVRVAEQFVVIEAKAGVLHPAEFVRQAILEADNFAKHRGLDRSLVHGICAAKKRNAGWADAYVLTTLREYFRLQ